MSNYIPTHRKKIYSLHKKERKLIGHLKRNESKQKIIKAAEEIRVAKLLVLKAKRNEGPFDGGPSERDAYWLALPVEEIISIYTKK